MIDVLSVIGDGLKDAFLMAWEVWWALVFGFAISAIVQAWVPGERIEAALSGGGVGPVAKATGLGAASSSCSYAAIAIAKSLFQKGASASAALAFQFASTNLVWELGLVLWVLVGWQFWGGLGASMLLAAVRGYGGCEVLAFANASTGRRDRIGCLLFTPIDPRRLATERSGRMPRRPHTADPIVPRDARALRDSGDRRLTRRLSGLA